MLRSPALDDRAVGDAEDVDPADDHVAVQLGGSPITDARCCRGQQDARDEVCGLRTSREQHRRRVSPVPNGSLRLRMSSFDSIVMRAREPMVGRWRPVSRSGRRSWPGLWARTPCAGPDPGAFGAVDHAATPSVVRLRWLIRPSQPVRQFTVRRNARPRSASRRALLGLPLRGITMLPMPSSGRSSSTAACRSRVRGHRARFPAGAFDQPFHRWFEPGRVGRVARLHVMVEQSSKTSMTTPVNFAVLAAHAKDGDRPVGVRVESRRVEEMYVWWHAGASVGGADRCDGGGDRAVGRIARRIRCRRPPATSQSQRARQGNRSPGERSRRPGADQQRGAHGNQKGRRLAQIVERSPDRQRGSRGDPQVGSSPAARTRIPSLEAPPEST